jgi:hypothetical protein
MFRASRTRRDCTSTSIAFANHVRYGSTNPGTEGTELHPYLLLGMRKRVRTKFASPVHPATEEQLDS